MDGSGDLFVADFSNDTIRKVTPAGVVSTFAGTSGVSGSADGTGAAARFDRPSGVAVDKSGNVYVVDNGTNIIRKITATGVVTTLAGTANRVGAEDGAGPAARFRSPMDLAVDSMSNLLVTDSGNLTVRKITPTGVVTTLAGTAGLSGTEDGTGTDARFNSIWGIVADAQDNLFVVETDGAIRKITPAGVVTTVSRPEGISATDLAMDGAGNFYLADSVNGVVRQITSTGIMTLFAGSPSVYGGVDGAGTAARFKSPWGLVADGMGNLLVSDSQNHHVRGSRDHIRRQLEFLWQRGRQGCGCFVQQPQWRGGGRLGQPLRHRQQQPHHSQDIARRRCDDSGRKTGSRRS